MPDHGYWLRLTLTSAMLYIDVDAVCKLAHWNILPVIPELTGFSWNEITTVSSLKYRAQRATTIPDGRLFRSVDAAIAALAHIAKMGATSEAQADSLALFEDNQQIDSGEAVLLALTMNDSDGYFLTGDKRALRAIPQYPEIHARVAGRVIMIEQILLQCLEKYGSAWLQDHVCPNKHIDTAVSMIMGSRCDGSKESIRDGIDSYITEIRMLCNPTLLAADTMRMTSR